jgi:hypothetical protein
MKTNRSARRVRKLQVTLLCLAVAVLAGLEFSVGESLAAQFGHIAASQTQGQAAPGIGLADVMAAMR